MSKNANMANREVANLVLLKYVDKAPFLNLDFANVTTTGFTANRVFAKGGQGAPNRVGFDGERAGTLKVDTQIMPAELFAMLSGKDIEKTAKILKREEITATEEGKLDISAEPKAGSIQVFAASDDCGTAIVGATAEGKKVSAAGITASNNYIVYYFTEKADVKRISFNADTFPRAFEIHGELPWKTENDEDVMCDLVFYKAQPQAAFDLAFQNTGDPTTLSITFDCYANKEGQIYDMVFEDGE